MDGVSMVLRGVGLLPKEVMWLVGGAVIGSIGRPCFSLQWWTRVVGCFFYSAAFAVTIVRRPLIFLRFETHALLNAIRFYTRWHDWMIRYHLNVNLGDRFTYVQLLPDGNLRYLVEPYPLMRSVHNNCEETSLPFDHLD